MSCLRFVESLKLILFVSFYIVLLILTNAGGGLELREYKVTYVEILNSFSPSLGPPGWICLCMLYVWFHFWRPSTLR
jgi:hypothetical protein